MAKASAYTINRDTVRGCNPEDEMNSRDYLLELRESTGMTRTEFCEYFEIPYRTLQDWELGNRKMPEYLLRLMAYKIKMEELEKKRDSKEKSQE
ncbi:MAG: helix-turn-helix domain-containing protein [Agathobacter sp.]